MERSAAMHRPDFFLVGAAKAGTTSLFQYLIQHPSIFIPSIKEPHYFSEFYDAGAPHCATDEEYFALFDPCPPGARAGDASTSYLYSTSSARRIHAVCPEARIMAVLRSPIDRAYSFYWYNRRNLVEELSFEAALEAEPGRIAEGRHYRFHYVTSGMYAGQIARYLETFGREAVQVHLFEDLRDAPRLCARIFAFLGVDPDVPIDTEKRFNPSGPVRSDLLARFLTRSFPRLRRLLPGVAREVKYRLMDLNVQRPEPMSRATRESLGETFRDDVLRLQEMIGRDLGHWLSTPAASPAHAP
jgi:hypothetical protein